MFAGWCGFLAAAFCRHHPAVSTTETTHVPDKRPLFRPLVFVSPCTFSCLLFFCDKWEGGAFSAGAIGLSEPVPLCAKGVASPPGHGRVCGLEEALLASLPPARRVQ